MKMHKNQNGQVILFVVISMVIALGLGIAVSARTLSSISRVTDTDTSARVLAAAEGGAERMLQKSYSELDTLMGDPGVDGDGACDTYDTAVANPSLCVFDYEYGVAPSPVVKFRSVSYVKPLNDLFYRVGAFNQGEVKQLDLRGYSGTEVQVCWTGPNSHLLYMALNETNSNYISKGYISTSFSPSPAPQLNAFTKTDAINDTAAMGAPYSEYSHCATIPVDTANMSVIRFRPLYGGVTKAMFAGVGSNLPNQGFTIESVGELNQANGEQIKRAVRVTKSYPYASYSFFDYAIYADQGDVTQLID